MEDTNVSARQTVPASDSLPSYKLYTGPVDKPELDTREYRIIQLANGLKAVLIHDATADKAAACVDVAVGHMQDPFDVPGLAHFCEHMISKGSKPYPVESDFLSFISANGGTRNASTYAEYQDYWFSINPLQLPAALSRLAAFFHSPLFTASLTSREMYAVDSENKRNLQNDDRRVYQLAKSLSISGHPWTKFGTGNVESLTEAARKQLEGADKRQDKPEGDGGPIGREVRRRLMEWWEHEYCASRMGLAVIGKESLDDLTKLVVPLFSLIPNRGVDPRPTCTDPVWGPEQQGSIVFVKTVKDYHEFSLTFHIPDQTPLFRTRPASYLAHFLGHEGTGSICAYLKKKGYLINITASPSSLRNRSIHTLEIEGKLTREGYLHYKEVILTIFNYISLLRTSDLEPFHYDEIAQMGAVFFRFKEKGQPHTEVKTYAHYMLLDQYPPQYLLSRGVLNREWDEKGVRGLLDLLKPELGRVILSAKDHDRSVVGEEEGWLTERWYGTEYRVKRLDEELVAKANEPNKNDALFLPCANPYIPEDLSVEKEDKRQPAEMPTQLKQSDAWTLWHKKDDQFGVPKAQVRLNIHSPIAYTTPRHAVLSRLLMDLLDDALNEATYDAHLAGLDFSVSNHRTGLLISFGGYNDKLPLLIKTVIEQLTEFSIDPARLKVMIEKLERSYKNFYLGQPSELSQYFTTDLLTPITWTPEQKLNELAYITEDDVDRHRREILSKLHLQALVTGNVASETSIRILEEVELLLSYRALYSAERPADRSLLLSQGSNFTATKRHTNPKETNSALTYYCQFGDISNVRLRATLQLLTHMLKEPTFSQLRTVEQLGYVVASSMWSSVGSMGFGFKIQSLKAPSFLEQRVESFIVTHRARLAATPADTFQASKDALVVKLLEAPKNLGEETSRFWHQVERGYNDFLRNYTDARQIQTLQLHEIVQAYDTYLMPNSSVRKKLSFHLASQQLWDISAMQQTSATLINDEAMFKRGLLWSPAAVPVLLDEEIIAMTRREAKL